jgi:hypothetical protein
MTPYVRTDGLTAMFPFAAQIRPICATVTRTYAGL